MAILLTCSPSILYRKLAEDQRRCKLIEQQLNGIKLSQEEFEARLQRQRETISIEQVDQQVGFTPPSCNEKHQETPKPDRRPRDIQRPSKSTDTTMTYQECLQRAKREGIYDEDFDDNLFGPGAFRRGSGKRQRMTEAEIEAEIRILSSRVEKFEEMRQELTSNFERMDTFARTQNSQMEKDIMALERARQERRLHYVEYLRGMDVLSQRAKQIKWQYHLRNRE